MAVEELQFLIEFLDKVAGLPALIGFIGILVAFKVGIGKSYTLIFAGILAMLFAYGLFF